MRVSPKHMQASSSWQDNRISGDSPCRAADAWYRRLRVRLRVLGSGQGLPRVRVRARRRNMLRVHQAQASGQPKKMAELAYPSLSRACFRRWPAAESSTISLLHARFRPAMPHVGRRLYPNQQWHGTLNQQHHRTTVAQYGPLLQVCNEHRLHTPATR